MRNKKVKKNCGGAGGLSGFYASGFEGGVETCIEVFADF